MIRSAALRIPRAVAAAGIVIATLLVAGGALIAAQSAGAVQVPGTSGDHLTLEADSYPADWTSVQPGDAIDWQVWPVLTGEPDAALGLKIDRGGDLTATPDGLQLLLRMCPVPWAGAPGNLTCSGGAGTTIVNSPMMSIDPTHNYDLGTIDEGSGPYFLATLSIPSGMTISQQQAVQGWTGSFGFGFTASGELVTITPAGVLASTGVDPLGPLLIGAGILLGGALLTLSRARRETVVTA